MAGGNPGDFDLGTSLAAASDPSRPRLIDRGRKRWFPRGTVLMRQGEQADAMYVILQGSVKVERTDRRLAKPLHLADLGTGQVVGEIGILNRVPRTATVTASTDVLAVELSRTETLKAIQEVPGLPLALLQLVSQRLAETDELAAKVASKTPQFERKWVREWSLPWPLSLGLTFVAHVQRPMPRPIPIPIPVPIAGP